MPNIQFSITREDYLQLVELAAKHGMVENLLAKAVVLELIRNPDGVKQALAGRKKALMERAKRKGKEEGEGKRKGGSDALGDADGTEAGRR